MTLIEQLGAVIGKMASDFSEEGFQRVKGKIHGPLTTRREAIVLTAAGALAVTQANKLFAQDETPAPRGTEIAAAPNFDVTVDNMLNLESYFDPMHAPDGERVVSWFGFGVDRDSLEASEEVAGIVNTLKTTNLADVKRMCFDQVSNPNSSDYIPFGFLASHPNIPTKPLQFMSVVNGGVVKTSDTDWVYIVGLPDVVRNTMNILYMPVAQSQDPVSENILTFKGDFDKSAWRVDHFPESAVDFRSGTEADLYKAYTESVAQGDQAIIVLGDVRSDDAVNKYVDSSWFTFLDGQIDPKKPEDYRNTASGPMSFVGAVTLWGILTYPQA